MISVRLQGKPLNITVIQVYAPTSNAEEAEVEQFYKDLKMFIMKFKNGFIWFSNFLKPLFN